MFKLADGRPLAIDTPFAWGNVSYPANWLRLSSPEERAAIGITEVPDPPVYDQRFYWGYDQDGKLIPKDHTQLVEQWTQQTRTTANTLLAPTDWIIIREADNGKPADADTKAWRESIRLATGTKVTAIKQTTDTAELAAYVTSAAYSSWPGDTPTPPQPGSNTGLEFTGNSISTGF